MRPTTKIQEWDDREAPGGTASVRAMSRETREEARANNPRPPVKEEDVPEHIRPLLEGISTEITPLQREELAAMLTEYQDVFSKGPT